MTWNWESFRSPSGSMETKRLHWVTSALPLPVSPNVVSMWRTWGSLPISASSLRISASLEARVEPGGVCT